jgi:predicted metal-dependent hydrolase
MLDWSNGELLEGMRCYREEKFFEAHERWEQVWLQSADPEKTFIQALIQVAGSFHHFRRGNLGGSRSMARKALQRLEKYPEIYGGVRVEHLRADLRAWIVSLDTDLVEAPAIPQIELL